MEASWTFSQKELEDTKIWLRSIRDRQRLEVYEKSNFYGFDFEAERPLADSRSKFRWEGAEVHQLRKSRQSHGQSNMSTGPSLGVDNDTIPDIPNIEEYSR